MRKGFAVLAALAATVSISSMAKADTFVAAINDYVTFPDGTAAGGFDAVSVNGAFDHTWTFATPEDGFISGSIDSTRVAAQAGITFTSVTLNGIELLRTVVGRTQFFSLDPALFPDDLFATAGTQMFHLTGTGQGAYGGSVAFAPLGGGGSPGGVPEPATWAMMIGGLGMIGMASRRRNRTTVTYA